jgi:hypothetical protein
MSFALNPRAQVRPEHDTVKNMVSMDARRDTSISHASSLLREAGVWGGIEEQRLDCSPDQQRSFPSLKGSLKEGLDQLTVMDSSLVWKEVDGGILIRRNPQHLSLLDTRIKEFGFDKRDRPEAATDALLSLSPVRRQITKLNLNVRSPELGFSQPRAEGYPDGQIILGNVTVRQALNAMASADHPKVWLFQETTCSGQTTLLIQWVVK